MPARPLLALPLVLFAAIACKPASAPPLLGSGDGGARYGGAINVRVANDPYDWDMASEGTSTGNGYGMYFA